MAGAFLVGSRKTINPLNSIFTRLIHRTSPLCEITSGKYKRTKDKSKPLTYEKAQRPVFIAHRKSWNSWNTTTLQGGQGIADVVASDVFIRKFIVGTFPKMIMSEIIIKRQHNIVRIGVLILKRMSNTKFAFLIAYTEEMLGYWLQCPVKLEPQFVQNAKDMIDIFVGNMNFPQNFIFCTHFFGVWYIIRSAMLVDIEKSSPSSLSDIHTDILTDSSGERGRLPSRKIFK